MSHSRNVQVLDPDGPTTVLASIEKRLEVALAGSRMGWFERDVDSGLVSGSPSCAEIFGFEDREGPWPFADFVARIVAEDRADYLDEIRLCEGGAHLASRAIRYRIRRPDGALRNIEARYGEIRDHGKRYRFGLVMDVTDVAVLNEQLEDNSAWLDIAMESINVVFWDRDLVTGAVRTSANYGAFFGLERGRTDWQFADFLTVVHPDDHAVLEAALASTLARNDEYGPKYRIVGAGGVHRWLESKGRLQRDVHGQPRRLIGVTWDVSERRLSEERLLGIANLVPGMVYQLQRKPDGQYTLTYVSEGIRGLCGLDAESARADAVSFLRHIHRDERERFLASSEASAAALSPWHEEFRMLDADGAQRWVEGHALPQRMPDGTVLWHGHIFDITERKAIESDLRETKGNLTMALAAARMVTWRWDLDSNAISSPQDLGEFFDLPRQDPTMEDILGNIHPDDRPHIDNAIRQAISQPSAETVRLEFRVPRANEKFHLLEVRARAEFDADGRLRGFRGVTVDLTDQRLGDQERSALQDQLQQAQKMELLGLMTGGIAHDFNNILASILGYAGLAARDASATLGERQAGYLEQIRVAAERGAELITQMLAFSRGETAARSPQALSALVQLAVKMLRPTFPSSIEIRTELDAALPPVVTTAVEIQQIVLNLCINARDAMPATGTIALSLAARKDCQEQCASCGGGIDGDFVVLTVADNGAGIPEDVCRRIFEPLFSTKSVGRGTGLGLAMVHGIVHRNHGHISVATAAGQGTRFDIYLPAASTPAKATSPSNADKDGAPSTRASRAARILVVDDEPSVAGFVGELLRLDGHDVHIEHDALNALKAVRATPGAFDLMISDQTMPKLTGSELAMRCKAIKPDLPIILMTGHSATLNARIADELGIAALLAKPVDTAALAAAIAAALRRGSARA